MSLASHTMNKNEEYLKFYINSNGSLNKIENFIEKENITLDEYKSILTDYIDELKNDSDKGNINKLYLEFKLKFNGILTFDKKKSNKRKDAEIIINIINGYINEDKHNIKEYVDNYNVNYNDFKKFINNYKDYYLTNHDKDLLKTFLKRENDFNKGSLLKVNHVVNKIRDDLVGDKPFSVYEYYTTLGWDSNLLIYFLSNNKETFSDFVIENVKIYLNKYHMNDKPLKLNEFLNKIKQDNKDIKKKDIDNIISFMNEHNIPYNYYLFLNIKDKII